MFNFYLKNSLRCQNIRNQRRRNFLIKKDGNNKKLIFLIRHGESEHNTAIHKTRMPNGQVNLDVKFSKDYVDALMTQTGKKQAQEASLILKNTKIKYVICSPIKRCIETAKIMFADHANSPVIILNPLVRELQNCAADIGSPLDDIIQTFGEIDWSALKAYEKPDLWHIIDSFDEIIRHELMEEIRQRSLNKSIEEIRRIIPIVILEKMKKIYPVCLESNFNVYNRVQKVKEEFRKILKKLEGEETIAVVSHHNFLQSFTAIKYDKESYKPIYGAQLRNGQIYEFFL